MNVVILIGNLGKDPEVFTSKSGNNICKFSLATTEQRKDNSGQKVKITEWHNIVTFGTLGDLCSKYLKKGRKVAVNGKIQSKTWQDAEGKSHRDVSIIADDVQFLDRSTTTAEVVVESTEVEDSNSISFAASLQKELR